MIYAAILCTSLYISETNQKKISYKKITGLLAPNFLSFVNYCKAIHPFVVVLKQKDDFLICFSLLEMPQVVPARSLRWAVLTPSVPIPLVKILGAASGSRLLCALKNHLSQKEQQPDISWSIELEDIETFAELLSPNNFNDSLPFPSHRIKTSKDP